MNEVVKQLSIRQLGLLDYQRALAAMQDFTHSRDNSTIDEIWWLQHPPVFTQGQAGKAEHLLKTGDIPVVQADRGGQVTYHGPGQLIGYLLINLKRRELGVRTLVSIIEQSIVTVLASYKIQASARKDAPGVYVESGAKIAQLGLRVRKGCSFHGLSLNVDMDLEPFLRINPCGYSGLEVTSMQKETGEAPAMDELILKLSEQLANELGYTDCSYSNGSGLPV